MAPLKLGKILGIGAENRVHKRYRSPESERVSLPTVIKVPRRTAVLWQTVRADHIRRCIESLLKRGFRVAPFEIHEKKLIKQKDGSLQRKKLILETPYDPDIDKKVLTYEDLTDEGQGPYFLRELVRYVHAADEARREEEIGYDPLGGEMFMDILKGVFQRTILTIAKILPETVKIGIEKRMTGIQAKVRNMIKEQTSSGPQLVCTDPGMHDFSEKGKCKLITLPIHYLAFAGLIQLIKQSNLQLPENVRLKEEELKDLPYSDHFFSNFSAKILWKILAPIFERHKNSHQKKDEMHKHPRTIPSKDPSPPQSAESSRGHPSRPVFETE